jgi:NADPH2:quinone reductase
VGAAAFPSTLFLIRPGGTVCFVGALSGAWTIPRLRRVHHPTGVHLTSNAGEAQDLPADALDQFLHAIDLESRHEPREVRHRTSSNN